MKPTNQKSATFIKSSIGIGRFLLIRLDPHKLDLSLENYTDAFMINCHLNVLP